MRTLLLPPPRDRGRIPASLVCSVLVHLAGLGLVLWVVHTRPPERVEEVAIERPPERIVWIAMPGPAGGGGGRTAPVPTPPRPVPPPEAQAPAPAPAPVPVEAPQPALEPLDPQPLVPLPLSAAVMPGALGTPAPVAGTGRGDGSGDGDGAGAGPGQDAGFGGGALRPGNGVTSPEPIARATPLYTAEAVRARAQGVIVVECVVETDGVCGETRIVQAFTPPFGLDQQALATARRWRFRPGMRGNVPVPVLVKFEIGFAIR